MPPRDTVNRLRRRGWVLLAALAVLALLSVLAAGVYLQALEASAESRHRLATRIAAGHAHLGLQQALFTLRSGQLDLSALDGGTCDDAALHSEAGCPFSAGSGVVDLGPAHAPDEGGGLQYRYVVFRRAESQQLVIRATGYSVTARGAPGPARCVLEMPFAPAATMDLERRGGAECL